MDICSAGSSCVANDADKYGLPRASMQRFIDDNAPDDEKAEDFGEMPQAFALGLMALPAPASEDGTCAELVYESEVGGFPAIAVGGFDARCTDVAGKLTSGDTAVFGTHRDSAKRAKVLCKENALSLLVGNDLLLQLDRENKVFTISGFGALFQFDDEQVLITDPQGKSFIKMKDGVITLSGNVVLGNSAAGNVLPVAIGPTSGVVSTSVAAGI